MKRIMVINDSNGHCHVFDVSTDNLLRNVLRKMLEEYLDWNLIEDTSRAFDLLKKGSGQELLKFIDEDESGTPFTGRSGGGRWYICKLESAKDWKKGWLYA